MRPFFREPALTTSSFRIARDFRRTKDLSFSPRIGETKNTLQILFRNTARSTSSIRHWIYTHVQFVVLSSMAIKIVSLFLCDKHLLVHTSHFPSRHQMPLCQTTHCNKLTWEKTTKHSLKNDVIFFFVISNRHRWGLTAWFRIFLMLVLNWDTNDRELNCTLKQFVRSTITGISVFIFHSSWLIHQKFAGKSVCAFVYSSDK